MAATLLCLATLWLGKMWLGTKQPLSHVTRATKRNVKVSF
jgi:hypothetical protein